MFTEGRRSRSTGACVARQPLLQEESKGKKPCATITLLKFVLSFSSTPYWKHPFLSLLATYLWMMMGREEEERVVVVVERERDPLPHTHTHTQHTKVGIWKEGLPYDCFPLVSCLLYWLRHGRLIKRLRYILFSCPIHLESRDGLVRLWRLVGRMGLTWLAPPQNSSLWDSCEGTSRTE